jgi:hypothetical protein
MAKFFWGKTDTRDSSVSTANNEFPKQKNFHVHGLNPDLDNGAFSDVWNYAPTQPLYLWPDTASGFRIAAGGNALDTAAGDNARSVLIAYLNEDGTLVKETLETNGALASLATAGIGRRLLWACVNGIGVKNNSNAGDILIEHIDSGYIVGVITIGNGTTQQTHYTIEKNYTGFIKGGFIYVLNATGTKEAHVKLWYRENGYLDAAPFGAKCVLLDIPDALGYVPFKFDTPRKIDELSDIWAEAVGNATQMQITVHYDLELRKF